MKKTIAAVVDAIAPRPALAERAERLRTARARLDDARKLTPGEPASYLGLPRADLVAPSIACCEAAREVRDAELSFAQNDVESDEIHHGLAETLSAKDREGRRLQAAVKAAQEALDAFCSSVDADVEKATESLQALTRRRAAEDLPGARCELHKPKFRELLGDLELAQAAEWLRQPVPGPDPSQGDYIQSRINEIQKLHAERERREALACCPEWENKDDWAKRWSKADSAGRQAMRDLYHGVRDRIRERELYPQGRL